MTALTVPDTTAKTSVERRLFSMSTSLLGESLPVVFFQTTSTILLASRPAPMLTAVPKTFKKKFTAAPFVGVGHIRNQPSASAAPGAPGPAAQCRLEHAENSTHNARGASVPAATGRSERDAESAAHRRPSNLLRLVPAKGVEFSERPGPLVAAR